MTQAERRREGLIEAPDAGDSAEGVEGTSAVASMGPATQGYRSLLLPRRLPLLSGVGVGGRSRSPRASRGGRWALNLSCIAAGSSHASVANRVEGQKEWVESLGGWPGREPRTLFPRQVAHFFRWW